jgi:hypothetical protein
MADTFKKFANDFKLLLAIAALATLPTPSRGAEPVKLRLFAPAWRNIGQQDPRAVAKDFLVVFGHLDPRPFHDGNPDCKCIQYVLGPYVAKSEMQRLPAEVLARDKERQVVKARDWANWLVVPDNPKWLEYEAQRAKALAQGPWDGLFTDSMGTAPVEGNYVLSPAINPNTAKPYGKRDWLAAECVMLDAVATAMPQGKLLILNGLGPGSRYWTEPEDESPRVLLKYVHGAMSESIWRPARAKLTAWPTPDKWMQDLRMIQDVEKRGLMGFWWTKCWTDGNTSNNEPDAGRLVPQWRRFALASYLLAAGPHSYFNFDTIKNDQPASNAAERFPEYDAPLGTATGEMRELPRGLYVRPFTNGVVLVNPTSDEINGIQLPGNELSAATLTSAGEPTQRRPPFTIAPHTGLILTRSPQ